MKDELCLIHPSSSGTLTPSPPRSPALRGNERLFFSHSTGYSPTLTDDGRPPSLTTGPGSPLRGYSMGNYRNAVVALLALAGAVMAEDARQTEAIKKKIDTEIESLVSLYKHLHANP